MLLGGIAIFLATRQILLSQFDATLIAKAQALTTAAEIDDDEFEIDLTIQDFAGFGEGVGTDYFEVRRADGGLLMRSPSLREGRLPAFDPPEHPVHSIHSMRLDDGRPARILVQRFAPKDDERKEYQDLHLVVASVNSEVLRASSVLAAVLLSAGFSALALAGPLVRLALKSGLKPLHDLAGQVQSIGPDELHTRIDTKRMPAELKPVTDRLNGLLERLEESFERERRFSSHAAHELRTPLAELRAMAEIGATWPEEATSERSREILAVADELDSLLEKLSLLARADAGRFPLKPERVELSSLLKSVLDRYSDLIARRGMNIHVECGDSHLMTDPLILSTILNNLIENAVAHSPAGSKVVIQASASGLAVENPAPGLEHNDLQHLFERFWRKDAARGTSGHSGLGLSIVKCCAALLGAGCHASLGGDHVLRLEISWKPAQSANG